MRCIIFGDNYKAPYQKEVLNKRFELIAYLKTKAIDFAFGLGSGQILALNLVGAYDKEVAQKIIEKRDDLIVKDFMVGGLAKISGVLESNLDSFIANLGKEHYLRKVDQFSEKVFLVSGDESSLDLLKQIGKVEFLRKGALHTILAKALISPYAEILRAYEIHPFELPLINTRNIGLVKQPKVAQELVDSLTLPQHFYNSFKRAFLLGVCEFYFIGDELQLVDILKTEFPEVKIEVIESLEELKTALV